MIPNNLLKNPGLVLLVGYSFVLLCTPGESKLSILKECGELICKEDQYCSKIDHSCRNCADTCNSQHNNYDLGVCEKDCQDFLHDLLYKRKPVDAMDEIQIMTLHKQSLEEDLHTITLLLGFVLISLAFMFIMISIILVFLLKHRKQFGDDTPKTVVNEFPIIYNKHCQKEDAFSIPLETKNDNNVVKETESKIIRSPSNASKSYDFSIQQKSTHGDKLRREPSESTLPEYVYDNPTLVPSPTHHM